MPIRNPEITSMIGFVSLKTPEDLRSFDEKYNAIEAIELTPPALNDDRNYIRIFNIASNEYQKILIQDDFAMSNTSISSDIDFIAPPSNSFGNRIINSPRLVMKDNEDIKTDGVVSPICVKCLGKSQKNSGCNIS